MPQWDYNVYTVEFPESHSGEGGGKLVYVNNEAHNPGATLYEEIAGAGMENWELVSVHTLPAANRRMYIFKRPK
jgi:hypothetical protein